MSLIQRERKVAYAKGSTWGTAVQPGANGGLFVKAFTPPKGARKMVSNEDEFGRGMASESQIMDYEGQSGSMSFRVYNQGLEEIVGNLMGLHEVNEVQAGKVYAHKFTLDPVMDSRFYTIAWEEGTEVKAINSARIVSGTFAYADGLNLDVNYLGDKTAVTGWADLGTVTYPAANQGIFKLSGATVEINDENGGDFLPADKYLPSGITIAVTRGFEALAVTAGRDTIGEPVEKTAPVLEVTLNFPKKEAQTASLLSIFNSRTYKKMRVKFASGQIPESSPAANYEIAFNFPRVYITEAPDYTQDTPVPVTVKFKALLASTAPAPMTATVPYITMQNGRSTLANF